MDPWSRGREVARGVQRSSPKPEEGLFCHRRGIENFCRLFSTRQSPNVFVSDAWPALATYHRSFCEHWPEGGSELLSGAPRSDFMAQSLVLSLDVCPGLGISPLRTNIWLSFSQADLGPTSAQELFFSGFLKSLKLFFRRFALIASGTEIFRRVSLKFELFMETSRSHCHRYKRPWMLLSLTTAETIPHYFHVENSCPQQRRWAQLWATPKHFPDLPIFLETFCDRRLHCCVFFTSYRSFYPWTSSAHPVSVTILPPINRYIVCGHKTTQRQCIAVQ